MIDCRAFLFFLGARSLYRDKLLSSKEIFCSPDAQTSLAASARALQTPVGSYDAAEFFSNNKLIQQPDILLVKADATGRNLPSNLKVFKCPRVLLVGDTHHMGSPIQKLVAYAKQEEFDRIIFDHTRHHARWFFEAGLKNIHWIPAFDFTFFPRTPSPNPSRQFSFVGQAGKFHPYCCQVLESLQKEGLPLEMLRGTPAEAADIYADSIMTLNVSKNGDLNSCVFEALAAGGFLLTDKLTPSSGLELLFKPGEDIDVWSSVGELIEKARHYLEHPAEADRIRRSGQQKLLEFHHPDIKIREFFELVFEGKENPLYSLDEEAAKARTSVQGTDLVPGVEAYEFLQEMHRTTPPLVVWSAEESLDAAKAFFADLPRVLVNSAGGAILFLSGRETQLDEMLGFFEGKWVVAPKALSGHLQEWGFVEVIHGVYEFAYRALRSLRLLQALDVEKVKADLPEILDACTHAFQALLVADKALALEFSEIYQKALQRALFLDRNSLPALFQLADLCLQSGAEEDAAILLHEAHRIQPLPPEINTLREDLEREFASSAHISEYKQAISGGMPAAPATTYSILVVTNLFPPQEMGGYGRKIWEFSNGLIKRGHRLKILTGDAPYLQKSPDAGEPDLEPLVQRSLVLQGEWKNGKTRQLGDLAFLRHTAEANKEKVLEAVVSFKPDFVLLGNFDFLGVDILRALIAEKMPVIHSLGNQTPGYHLQESIESPLYTIAPASDWLGKNLLEQGYKVSKLSTVYPGARVDRFYKQFLPDIRRLRIAFAGLVMPYKGAHVLMDALNILNQSGIEFEADFAGDSTDEGYIRTLKEFAQNNSMAAKVRFNGFLDREGLAALFARCNVLVFPTQVPEAFGISQVEAMASGLIVITSGTGGTQEVIRHGTDGLVFEMGSAVSLAQNLAALATKKELRDRLQINSQKRAMQFSVTESVVRIEKNAREMLDKLKYNTNNKVLIKKSDFYLCTLSQPPRDTVDSGPTVSGLLFQCSPGPLASQLLAGSDFEPYVGAYHRTLSAISIEALCISGHYLTQLTTKKTIFAPHSYPLFFSRAANPALCISFFWPPEAQESKRLMSLILYNEFQMPLGLFDHASRRFLIYTQQALPEAETFFEREKGPELLQHLIQLEKSGLLETYTNRHNLRPAIHFGFNRSFGHTHWNDVLGLLHLRQSSISSRIPKNLTTLQGPYAWVNPKLLTPEPRYKFDSVPELTEHVLKEGLSVQVPLGFSIDQKYVDFWKNEVSALAQPDRWGIIQEMRRKCSPIIAFNIRFGEIWRRGWKDCFVQLPQIISALHARYPNLGIVFDGLTAYHAESHDKADSRSSNLPEGFLAALPAGVPVVDISGESIGLKTAAYSAVDYAISQFGSGETIPAWVYALPWISISAEPDIVASYGSPNVITRQCKPAIQDATRHGTFLPIDHLVIDSDGYSVRLPETVAFILSHLQHCGLASKKVCSLPS